MSQQRNALSLVVVKVGVLGRVAQEVCAAVVARVASRLVHVRRRVHIVLEREELLRDLDLNLAVLLVLEHGPHARAAVGLVCAPARRWRLR